jgi:hypothetical protein
MSGHVEFHFKRLDLSGATLVVVAVGTKIYGACALEPLVALHAVAWRASEDLASRRQPIDPNVLIEWGQEELRRASSAVEAEELSNPVTFPADAA